MSSVLDSSVVLALLFGEAGTDRVETAIIDGAMILTVNATEVMTRQIDRGISPSEAWLNLRDLELEVVPFDEDLAFRAGLLRRPTRSAGLSLGDRACLALAERMNLPALTADRAWGALSIGIQVEVIR